MPLRLDEVLDQAKPTRRHLYIVLDDLSHGYSIRKMVLPCDPDPFNPDLSADLPFNSARSALSIKQLPLVKRLPPVIFRFQAKRELPRCFVASFNSILAILPIRTDPPGGHFLNVYKRTCRYCPLPEPNPAYPIYITAGYGALFALADDSFELLCKEPALDAPPEDWGLPALGSLIKLEPSELVWRKLCNIRLPFSSKDVTSYAFHGAENIIFVSTKDGTFVYNTMDVQLGATDHSQWDKHSEWVLPFIGCGHFDSDLQAWIGLSNEFPCHLCSCDVFSAYPIKKVEANVKICKEFFLLNSREKLVGATLISCGVRSYYCLLQCISVDDDLEEQSVDEELEEQSLLRLWTFYVVYDKNGDLTVGDRQAQDYILPPSVSEEFKKNPVAFWM